MTPHAVASQQTGVFPLMRAALKPQVPMAIRDELMLLQLTRLRQHMPELCLVLTLSVLAATLAMLGDLPWYRQFLPPALLGGVSLILFVRSRRRNRRFDIASARVMLKTAPRIAGALGVVAGFWCVSAFSETEKYYCVVAPAFVTLAVLMAANCLADIPRAATAMVVATISPIAIKMLIFDNLGIRCIAVMMILISAMQLRLMYQKFQETVRTLSLQRDMRTLAETDPLTQLSNRRIFDAQMTQLLSEPGTAVTVVMLDLDGFKQTNDRFGHHSGDAVLIEVAARLRNSCGHARCIARLGGDEFAVLFGPEVSSDSASRFAEAARARINQPISVDDQILPIATSLGIAFGSGDGGAITKRADEALYADKAQRHNPAALQQTALAA